MQITLNSSEIENLVINTLLKTTGLKKKLKEDEKIYGKGKWNTKNNNIELTVRIDGIEKIK